MLAVVIWISLNFTLRRKIIETRHKFRFTTDDNDMNNGISIDFIILISISVGFEIKETLHPILNTEKCKLFI